jgi:hypothetical protein
VLAGGGLDQPATFVTESGDSPNIRRVLVDLHDEYARHVGHADLLREAADGLVGEDPAAVMMAAMKAPLVARRGPPGLRGGRVRGSQQPDRRRVAMRVDFGPDDAAR